MVDNIIIIMQLVQCAHVLARAYIHAHAHNYVYIHNMYTYCTVLLGPLINMLARFPLTYSGQLYSIHPLNPFLDPSCNSSR